jgi:hypothetical protein
MHGIRMYRRFDIGPFHANVESGDPASPDPVAAADINARYDFSVVNLKRSNEFHLQSSF